MQDLECYPAFGSSGSIHRGDEGSPLTPTLSRRARGKKAAFTLAEVLITLAIIGVVAAMTIPTLINNYQEKVTVTKVKKAFNTLTNAYRLAQIDHGSIDQWGIDPNVNTFTGESASIVANKIKPYLRVIDDCGTSTCDGYIEVITYLSGVKQNKDDAISNAIDMSHNNIYKMRLADGVGVYIRSKDNAAELFLDINDGKEPNILGKDIFHFAITSTGVIDTGVGEDPSSTSFAACNPKKEGWYCTGWVIHKGNMDYLKCPDNLTWADNKCPN